MKLNKKGFTLVELLVTIVIIGLVAGFSIFGIINVVNNSKEKVIVINEKSIKEAANIYSSEADSSSWKKNSDYDAFCVTVGELMNKGFLEKNSIIENKKIDKDTYVIVKRNNITFSIISEEIVPDIVGDEYNKICTGQSSSGENYTAPTINTSTNYTDMLKIPFGSGSATSGIKNYKCLYGDSSSNVNKEGNIENNNTCVINNLKNNKDYYVLIYMNTNDGSSILADGSRNYKTSDFNNTTFTQNKNIITVKYNNKDTNGNNINNPSYYFNSTIDGTSNIEAEVCILENNKYICAGNTKDIKKDTWYKVQSSEVKITYPEENNDVKIYARIYDGSNNYKANDSTFKINKYTVRFYKNSALSIDGSTDTYITRYCIAGGTDSCSITSPTIEAPEGYTVIGWNTSATASSSSWNVGTSKEIKSSLNYYAISRINVVTILYNVNTGTVSESTTSEKGTTYNWKSIDGIIYKNEKKLSQIVEHESSLGDSGLNNYNNKKYLYISKLGYQAVGDAEWICLSGCTVNGKTFNQTNSYSASEFCDTSYNDCMVTLGVNWTTVTYTISYNLNSGSVSGNPTTYTIESSTITLKNPTRTGYTFTGWTGSNGSTPSTSVTIPKGSTGNKSYTANWSANSYTYNIVYKSSSGKELGTDTITKKYGTTNTVNPKSFTGYTSPSSQSIKWDSTSAKTITFTYTPTTYSITYTLNSGSVSGNPTTYTIESSTITLKNPTRTGYTFTGWTGSNGSTPSKSVTIPTGSTGNKSYTANWEANTYTVQWVNEDGTLLEEDKNVAYGTTPTYNGSTPTKAATAQYTYTFTGWSPKETSVTGDATYTATYTSRLNTYTITYNANGGSGAPGAQTATIGVPTVLGNDIPKRGTASCNSDKNYIFLGWSTNSGATSPSYYYGSSFTHNENSNVTLYAVWESNGTRFTRSSSDSSKINVYNITHCKGSVCTYDILNGTFSSGTVSKSSLYTNDSLQKEYPAPVRYMGKSTLHCYCSPSTSSNIDESFPWCDNWMIKYANDYNGEGGPNYIAVWPTTVSGWYYSRSYDCFVQSSDLAGSYSSSKLPTSTTVAPALSACPIVPSCTITSTTVISNKKYSLTINASDYGGLASSAYSWDNSIWTTSNKKTVTVISSGTYTAYVKDAAGHVGSCSITVGSGGSGAVIK